MSMNLPSKLYLEQVERQHLQLDSQQLKVLHQLDHIFTQLVKRQKKRLAYTGRLRRRIKPRQPITGLYLWGTVGIGKTHLMDLFYKQLPVQKLRLHFHAFMRDLHQQLREKQGMQDPLKHIAKSLADNFLVICFDEFFVSNIADAMLLGTLFRYLFAGGICLVTTSNVDPDHLYQDGIQREQFLPTIKLLKQHTIIIHLQSNIDYRLEHIKSAGIYHSPLNQRSNELLELSFIHYAQHHKIITAPIEILGRYINLVQLSDSVVWFDFTDLCSPPRSQQDYLVLSQQFDTIIISQIPQLDDSAINNVTLFISLIDILYDSHTRMIASAAVPIDQLYSTGRLGFEFKRTASRLHEMNSAAYFT